MFAEHYKFCSRELISIFIPRDALTAIYDFGNITEEMIRSPIVRKASYLKEQGEFLIESKLTFDHRRDSLCSILLFTGVMSHGEAIQGNTSRKFSFLFHFVS